MFLLKNMHTKCRSEIYPLSNIKRLTVPDKLVPWFVDFPNYIPPEYESPVLHNKPWADPPITDPNFDPKWNSVDGKINRQSHSGQYEIRDGRPLNPKGRTGLKGRGVLGKWGPNHAADPIVTRWKLDTTRSKVQSVVSNSHFVDRSIMKQTILTYQVKKKRPILQFCAIQRKDCGQWALPGGMVDPGEKVSETLKREFMEEAFNSLETPAEQRRVDEAMISEFFAGGVDIYKGYVDDPRNTDNAWMETVAVNFHDEDGHHVGKFNLRAGDDAAKVRWLDIDASLDLYASHSDLLKAVVERLSAHW